MRLPVPTMRPSQPLTRLLTASLAGLTLATAVHAGPLLDRLRERRQAQASSGAETGASVVPTTPGTHRLTLAWRGETRQWMLHVPPGFQADRPTAIVYFFHGGGGNMEHGADDELYGQISASDRLGHLVVFPNGHGRLRSGKMATWNAGNCCGAARDEQIDDVGFVRALHTELGKRFQIDPKQVFAAGMSNGAMMSYRLACEASDLFSAITAVAGTDNTRSCQPTRAVSVLHIHAKDDERVLYNGGAGKASDQVTEFTSVADSVARWVKHDACQSSPRTVLSQPGASCVEHDGCQGASRVRLCVTDTGGHSWPGGQKARGGRGSDALSATDEMTRFFFGR